MRYFVFDLQESPKYLVAQGRDEEAVAVYLYLVRYMTQSTDNCIILGSGTYCASQRQDHLAQN